MLPELTGLTLQAAQEELSKAGITYTLRKTSTPFSHTPAQTKIYQDYAVRFEQGELTYASFPVLSMTEEPREGKR